MAVKSCTLLAVQADGSEITTVEGLAKDGALDFVQQSFWDRDGLQCGFCTPGMLIAAKQLLDRNPQPHRRRDPPGERGEPLPVHGVPTDRRVHPGRRRSGFLISCPFPPPPTGGPES